MRARVVVLLVAFLLIGQISIVSEVPTGEIETILDWTPSSVVVENFVEDPYLDSEPAAVTNGTSGEFSSSYHQAIDEEDFNYMELSWTHVANTSLGFRIEEEDDLPDCFDFIYFYQSFVWTSNKIPMDAEFHFNYSTTLTGSFASEDYGNLMFRVYIWMIDSSGDWIRVYESREAVYTEVYQEKRVNFNYFGLQRTWGGMIENASGIQEDPTDTIEVAVGIAPRHYFESFHMYEDDPWEFYDGSVSVRVNSMELWTYVEEDPDPSQVLSPLYNSRWDYPVSEVFPDIPEEFENSSQVSFRDIETAQDGSVYVLCRAASQYELYVQQNKSFSYEFLQKYSPRLELEWSVRNDNRTTPHALTVLDGFIYTTGYIYTEEEYHNVVVTKWSSDGNQLWQTEWGGGYDEEGCAITVASDGSVFVWAAYYNIRFEPDFYLSSFLKFDSSGTLLWNKTGNTPLMPIRADLEMQPDGMYSWDTAYVEKRDLTCEPVWNISRSAFAANFDDSGNVYTATTWYWGGPGALSDEWQMTVSKWSTSGLELWQTNYSIPLMDGSFLNFQCRSIDVAPDGSVLAILHEMHLTYDYHMVKFDSSGSFQWDKLIGDEHWPLSGSQEPKLHIGDNGLAYVGFNWWGDFGYEVAVCAFVIGPYSLDSALQTVIIIGVVGGIVLIVGAFVYVKKYR